MFRWLGRQPLRHRLAMNSALFAAVSLREEPVTETSAPIAPRQRVERTWTLPVGAPVAIDHLVVAVPGLTVVSVAADDDKGPKAPSATPIVRISTENADVLEAFEVHPHGPTGLEIRATRSLHKQCVLTEITLPAVGQLRGLESNGGGVVVLEDKVLTTHDPEADVRIRLTGSGDVLATSHSDIHVNSVTVELTGSGDLQLVAPSVTARSEFLTKLTASGDLRTFMGKLQAPVISLQTTGSGDLQLAALHLDAKSKLEANVSGSGSIVTLGDELHAGELLLSITGSGDLKVAAKENLTATTLRGAVAGSGDVEVASHQARVETATYRVTGSGSVDARDVVARTAESKICGSGDSTFRASDEISSKLTGSGSATVVGPAPPRVLGKVKFCGEKDSRVDKLLSKLAAPLAVPARAEAFDDALRFQGGINVSSFSDLKDAISLLWYGRRGKVTSAEGAVTIEKTP